MKYSALLFLIIFLKLNFISNENEFQEKEQDCEMKKNCYLPKCKCESKNSSINWSNNYRKDEIPQLVVLTIDDDNLNIESYQVYKKLFENIKNQNNHSIKATFFLSDSYNQTSFCLIRNLYEQNHEIAISTVNYTCPHKLCNLMGKKFKPWTYHTWLDQILNMRNRIHLYSGIPLSDIIGFRAPILEPASDLHYKILTGNKFLYDSSLVVADEDLMSWPFTLDFPIKSVLSNNGPMNKHKGLWEIPLPIYIGYNNSNILFEKQNFFSIFFCILLYFFCII
jgi:hypothetical protein